MVAASLAILSLLGATHVSALPTTGDLSLREFAEPFILNIASTYCDNIIVNSIDERPPQRSQGTGVSAMIPSMYKGDDGEHQKLRPDHGDTQDEYCKIAEIAFTDIPKNPRQVDIGTGTTKVDGKSENLYASPCSWYRRMVKLTEGVQCTVDFDQHPGSESLTWFIGLPLDFEYQPTFNITCFKDCELLGDSNNTDGLTCMDSYFDLIAMHA